MNRRTLALALICLAQLMITLDSTIISVALPSVQHSLRIGTADRQWPVTAYTLAFGSLLLLGGRVSDLIGRRRAMLVGVAGFAVASAVGGAAGNSAMLTSARALQGAFAALIAPSTLSLVAATFVQVRERAKALSFYTAVMMTGGGVGLVLGGVLTASVGWRWCFYVNLPVAVMVLIGGARWVPDPPNSPRTRLDIAGAALSGLGMSALIYGLAEAATYGWGSGRVLSSLAAAVLLLVAFVRRQARSTDPLLPLRVLKTRDSGSALLTFVLSAFCTYGMLLGVTYQLQDVMHYSSFKAGLTFLGYVATAVVWSTQVATRLVRLIRPGVMIAAGMFVFAVALGWLTRLTPTARPVDVLPPLILFGIGVGTITVPAITTIVAVNDPRDQSVFSATVNTAQQAGASIGAALLNTISVYAANAYLGTHVSGSANELHAAAHGFAVASAWSAGVALVGTMIAAATIRVDLRAKERTSSGSR